MPQMLDVYAIPVPNELKFPYLSKASDPPYHQI